MLRKAYSAEHERSWVKKAFCMYTLVYRCHIESTDSDSTVK